MRHKVLMLESDYSCVLFFFSRACDAIFQSGASVLPQASYHQKLL